jgi:hypothetical protein
VVALGEAEADYLLRHIDKVRGYNDATARAQFAQGSGIPAQLETLRTVRRDTHFERASSTLQAYLAAEMRGATNAKDCVFAAIRTTDNTGTSPQVTLLKLDAVIEAARLNMLEGNRVSFEVLQDLLPEPGDLQKGISWPDPRPHSEVMTVDRNRAPAAYFENAYQVLVSVRSPEAEASLVNAITERVEPEHLPRALERASEASGPLDDVLDDLAQEFPQLTDFARDERAADRPTGIVRPRQVTTRQLVWRAGGIDVVVPQHLLGNVEVRESGDQWQVVVTTSTRPRLQSH